VRAPGRHASRPDDHPVAVRRRERVDGGLVSAAEAGNSVTMTGTAPAIRTDRTRRPGLLERRSSNRKFAALTRSG
jgi:hypothetical protein